VKVNLSKTPWNLVYSGIPQGSVLGPILFLFFINDLVESCENHAEIYLFADDAKLFKHTTRESDKQILQKGIYDLHNWCNRWMLKLNTSKCKVLSVGRILDKTYTYDLEQDHQTTSLERVESIQDLGVLVDERLSFSEHMQNKINKAYAMLGVITQNFKYLKTSSFILLYMVRFRLDYCSSVPLPSFLVMNECRLI